MMHSSLLLGLSSFALEVYNSFQSFVREVVLQHLLLIHLVYFRLFISASVAAPCKFAVAMGGPVRLVGDFVVRVPICVSMVLPQLLLLKFELFIDLMSRGISSRVKSISC